MYVFVTASIKQVKMTHLCHSSLEWDYTHLSVSEVHPTIWRWTIIEGVKTSNKCEKTHVTCIVMLWRYTVNKDDGCYLFCEMQWRHRKPFWTATRWMQCYRSPPYFIVLDC